MAVMNGSRISDAYIHCFSAVVPPIGRMLHHSNTLQDRN